MGCKHENITYDHAQMCVVCLDCGAKIVSCWQNEEDREGEGDDGLYYLLTVEEMTVEPDFDSMPECSISLSRSEYKTALSILKALSKFLTVFE